MAFDFGPLFPAGLPGPAAKWTGAPKFNFTGGNNDPDAVPVEGLMAAAQSVLAREGRTLSSYGLRSGPQGYRPLREFLAAKLKRDGGINCSFDDILIVSGSLQALDLVNGALLARGDTVIVEKDNYQGTLTRLQKLGVNAVGIPLDSGGMRMDVLETALAELKGRNVQPKYIYTIPTVQNPTGTVMEEGRRATLLELADAYDVPIFEDDCYADLVWDVRFLPNPHFVPALRRFTGKDPRVKKFIRSFPQTGEFLRRIDNLLAYLIPHYIGEGKSYLTIAIGCTGGKHRSVMMAEELRKSLEKHGYTTKVVHRDLDK